MKVRANRDVSSRQGTVEVRVPLLSKPTCQHWQLEPRCSAVGDDRLTTANREVFQAWLRASLPESRHSGCLNYKAGAFNPLFTMRGIMNDPIVSKKVFLPCGTSPFSSFTSSLVALAILFLAIPAACRILLRTATPQASWPAPAAAPLCWKQERSREHECVSVRLSLVSTDKFLCVSPLTSTQIRTSARSLVTYVAPGTARTPSAPIAA